MPTLADKYLYKGLSGETYPDRKAGAQEGVYEIGDLSLTQYLVPQECGMRMDTEWLEITRHTALDNSRTDSASQILRIEKNGEKFAFSCLPYTASELSLIHIEMCIRDRITTTRSHPFANARIIGTESDNPPSKYV